MSFHLSHIFFLFKKNLLNSNNFHFSIWEIFHLNTLFCPLIYFHFHLNSDFLLFSLKCHGSWIDRVIIPRVIWQIRRSFQRVLSLCVFLVVLWIAIEQKLWPKMTKSICIFVWLLYHIVRSLQFVMCWIEMSYIIKTVCDFTLCQKTIKGSIEWVAVIVVVIQIIRRQIVCWIVWFELLPIKCCAICWWKI